MSMNINTSYDPCKNCHKDTVTVDDISGSLVCEFCGTEQDVGYANYLENYGGGYDREKGNYVRVVTDGASSYSEYTYKENKEYNSKKRIEEVILILGMDSASIRQEVGKMIVDITEGGYGAGNWFDVLIAACAYIVMRKNGTPFSMAFAASSVACDVHELGAMVKKVVQYLELRLPGYDIVYVFETAIRKCESLVRVFGDLDDNNKMIELGRFLLQCSIKWCLTTGRQPNPLIVAVLVFIGEVHSVDIRIEEVAKELRAGLATCVKRHKELKETLVKAAKVLPWGKNVTVKNVVKHAPFLIEYMKSKTTTEEGEERNSLEAVKSDLRTMVNDMEKETQLTEVENSIKAPLESFNDLEEMKISQECMAKIYTSFLNENACAKLVKCKGTDLQNKRKVDYEDLWKDVEAECFTSKSDMCVKLPYEDILKKNVGYDNLPPSFVAGELACQRRREKIKAAKLRIEEIVHPRENNGHVIEPFLNVAKRAKIDNEDLIIQVLLLHQVKEEEIEKGYYKSLLDIYVFNSVDISEMVLPRKRRK